MTNTELLDQFVIEARECLEAIGQRLLEVERTPGDMALLNDLFRYVHTLKGNCGLFDFKPLEQIVHAGEDLLDRVRSGTMAYSPALADALLDAMDHSVELIDQIERQGSIDAASGSRAAPLAAALRRLLPAAGSAAVAADSAAVAAIDPAGGAPSDTATHMATNGAGAAAPGVPPQWLGRVPAGMPPGALALNYVPEPDCFFKGEDPWRLAYTTPGLQHLHLATQHAWPQGADLDALDCYRCNLDIVLVSTAPRDEIDAHFRCVPEQVDIAVLAPAPSADALPGMASMAEAVLRERAAALWADQLTVLARPGIAAGSVVAAARSLRGLLCTQADARSALAALDALPENGTAAGLLDWARCNDPSGSSPASAGRTAPGPSVRSGGGASPKTGPAVSATMAGSAGAAGDDGAADRHQRVLKVSQDKIDRLMDLIGEMVVAKNSLPYLAQRAEEIHGQRELSREIKSQYAVINRIAEDMQHAIMQVRMMPVGAVFQRFGRLVRDISKKLGKDVNLVVEGEDTEADKNVIESLADPLIHILRNSLDHGIESPEARRLAGKPIQGTIRIHARQESDRVIIEIADDGAGIDPQRVRDKAVERGLIPADRALSLSDEEANHLIFLPGFSTADNISDLSGRGVGMDVVRNAVERINGSIELESRKGHGTAIRLSLPLSMAVTNVMVVESAGRRLGVPMDLIVETVRVHAEDIHHFKQARTTVLRGRVVPLLALNDLLAIDAPPLANAQGELAVLVVRVASGNAGLIVDHFQGASDIILKPLEGVLAGLTGFAGTALMGDGGVLMVINPKELLP
jgi:two-component system chemotaxis sensor kinase CheA